MTDHHRLMWLMDQFYLTDGAWLASICLPATKDGICAEIDRRINDETLRLAVRSECLRKPLDV